MVKNNCLYLQTAVKKLITHDWRNPNWKIEYYRYDYERTHNSKTNDKDDAQYTQIEFGQMERPADRGKSISFK